jgi:membrane protein
MTSPALQQPRPLVTAPAPLPAVGGLLRTTFEKWYLDNIPRHAAALAFYTLFAVAPLLLLAAEIMGALYGRDVAEAQLVAQVQQYVHSPETAALVQTILDNTLPTASPWWVTLAAIISLIYGASSVFGELQIVLNLIWGAPLMLRDDIWGIVLGRLLAVVMVVASGLLIFSALVITTWSDVANSWALRRLQSGGGYEEWSYSLVLFLLMTLVFTLIYKLVPHVSIAWHDVIIGAVATAFLISIARLLITWYLSHSRVGVMFGTAGSLVILLLWVYYSAQIFFLGAEFTYVYSHAYGARRRTLVASTEELPVTGVVAESQKTEEQKTEMSAEERAAAEVITAEIAALPPLELEPEKPVALAVVNEEKPKRRIINLPRPLAFGEKIEALRARLAPFKVSALRSRLAKLWEIPLRLTRPFREIIVAVGVIGALSLAALFSLPWRKRRVEDKKAD